MKWWESILCISSISFCHYAYIKTYSNIFCNIIKSFNAKDVFIILLITIVTFYNTFYNYNFLKIIISFIELFFVFKIIFKERNKICFFKTIELYFWGWIIEFLLSVIFVYFIFNSLENVNSNIAFKVMFSTLMMLILLLLSYSKKFKQMCIQINNYMNKIFNLYIFVIMLIFFMALFGFYLIVSKDIISTLITLFLLMIFVALLIYIVIQSIKAKKTDENQQLLFKFMKEYEGIIDKERQDRHEIVNNLLILKSIKNKNTKEYEEILEEILQTYKGINTFRGLYDLPSGLKGIFYYKVYDMKSKNINISINISNLAIAKLENINSKTITKICKILGILLDNAKESAEITKEKIVIIEVYQEKSNIVIYIENSCSKKIDLKKIRLKGYSTKGNNRGYGLYLIEKAIGTNKTLSLEQKIENSRFISILQIDLVV